MSVSFAPNRMYISATDATFPVTGKQRDGEKEIEGNQHKSHIVGFYKRENKDMSEFCYY